MSKGLRDYIFGLLEKRKDLRDIAIVLPSLRSSFFLDRSLAKDWGVVLPPKVFSIQRFWDYLLSQVEDFRRVSLLDVLVDLKRVVEKRIDSMADWKVFYPWAYPLFSAIEQITLSMVSENKLCEVASILTGHDTKDDFYRFWEEIPSIRDEFYARLREKKMFTRAMVTSCLLTRMKDITIPFKKVIVAGLFLETEMERECLRRIKEKTDLSIYLLKVSVPGLEDKFDKLAQSLSADGVWSVPIETDRITVLPCRSELDEVKRVIRSLPERVEDPTDVGIVLPREELLMAFLDELSKSSFPINISMGYPLKSTSGYDFLQRLIRIFEHSNEGRFFYRDYLDVISHFYFSEVLPELAQARLSLVRYSEEIGRVFFSIEEIESFIPDNVKQLLQPLHRVLVAVVNEASVRDIISALADLFWWLIETNSALSQDELEREVVYRFYLILNHMLSSAMATEDLPVKVLFAYLRTLLLQEYVGFEGSPLRGLQIMGSLQARNLGFKQLHYLDLNEGMCPGSVGVDLFLPDPIREFLGMPRLKDRELMYAYDFYSTVALSDEVKLYYVRWPDSKFAVSRFVHQLRFLARTQGKELSEREDVLPFGITLPTVDEEFSKMPVDLERVTQYSPSALDTYLKCPVRYYYKYILSIPEPVRNTEDPDHREVGTLVHSILSEIYLPVVKERLSESFFISAKKKIESISVEKAKQIWGKIKCESIRGQAILKVIIRRLQDFLDVEMKRWKIENFVIEFIEHEEEEISFELELGDIFGPVKLYGRADRIDRIGEEFIIWDYKTGTISKPNPVMILSNPVIPKEELRGRIRAMYSSIQLPVYLILFSESWSLSPRFSDAGLISLKDLDYVRLFMTRSGRKKVKGTDREKLAQLVNQHVVELIYEIRDITIPYQSDKSFCRYCPYRSACQMRGE